MSRVVIIGGGITGLAAAHTVLREGTGHDITLLEAKDRLGGTILTEREKPFLLDGGPDSFLAVKPDAVELCKEVGIDGDLIPTTEIPDRVRILVGGRLRVLPDSFLLGLPASPLAILKTSLLSIRGKLRLALERFVPARREGGDESLADFFRRRLGREACERFAEPLFGGIHSGDPEALSIAATFPEFRRMELDHGSITRALKARQQAAHGSRPRAGFLTLRGGMGDLVKALAERLEGVDVRRGAEVTEVKGERPPYQVILKGGDPMGADALILATPSHGAARIFSRTWPDLSLALARIPYVTTAVVFLAYLRSPELQLPKAHGFLVPRTEGRPINACTFVSSKFPGRSPEEQILIRAYLGGADREDVAAMPDGKLTILVQNELEAILGIKDRPEMTRVYRWEKAMPQYNLGHRDRVYAVEKLLAGAPGLFVAGAAYHGSGIPNCIQSGREAARQAMKILAR